MTDRLFNIYTSRDLKNEIKGFKSVGYGIRLYATVMGVDDAHYFEISLATMVRIVEDAEGDIMVRCDATTDQRGVSVASFTLDASDAR
jgi:hypothetical protein